MRELTMEEIDHVGGGALEYGTGPNGIFSVRNIAAGTRFAAGISLLYYSFKGGWMVGTALNREFGISSAISERMNGVATRLR